jgi:hypothetical protein
VQARKSWPVLARLLRHFFGLPMASTLNGRGPSPSGWLLHTRALMLIAAFYHNRSASSAPFGADAAGVKSNQTRMNYTGLNTKLPHALGLHHLWHVCGFSWRFCWPRWTR